VEKKLKVCISKEKFPNMLSMFKKIVSY